MLALAPGLAFEDVVFRWRTLVAGLGAFAFARAHGRSLRASLLAGLVFELGGSAVDHVFLPWVLLAFDRLVERRDARATVLVAFAVALALLGGSPESAWGVFGLGSLYFVSRSIAIALEGPDRGVAWVVNDLARAGVSLVAGHLLAAFQLLPWAEVLTQGGPGVSSLRLDLMPEITFCVAFLAATGYDALARGVGARSPRGRRWLALLIVGALGGLCLRAHRERPVRGEAPVAADSPSPPRARVVYRARRVPDREAALEIVADPTHHPRDEVVIELPGQFDSIPGTLPGAAARAVREGNHRVVVTGEAREAGWVVLEEAWSPGWRATVDGDWAAILRADAAFRAVAVGAGEHTVVFDYAPASFRIGAWLAGVTAALLLIALARSRGRA